MKKLLVAMSVLVSASAFAQQQPPQPPNPANIQSTGKYDSYIPNIFAFCAGPKPCRKCQPLRSKYEELCDKDQKQAMQLPGAQPLNPSNTPGFQQAQQLNQQVQNSPGMKQAMELNDKAHSALGIEKPVPLMQQFQQQQQQVLNIGGQQFPVTLHQAIDQQVLLNQNGQPYQNNKVVAQQFEYNGQMFQTKEQLEQYLYKTMEGLQQQPQRLMNGTVGTFK